jgi:hypothetical protein
MAEQRAVPGISLYCTGKDFFVVRRTSCSSSDAPVACSRGHVLVDSRTRTVQWIG